MDKHLPYMQRAVELAEKARGICSPNPSVGAVIVKNNLIIGEGFTQTCGTDHAEVQAIKNCTQDCRGSEMYVTLEPCSHHGKTPPCAKAIIESGIKTVYIGITDPNPVVNGKGIEMLKAAKIKVDTGFLADIITKQLEYYLTYITRQRPFVILKTAVSIDGRIASEDGSSKWITCDESRKKVHEMRQEVNAIITGIGTVLKDDPELNVRLEKPLKQPLRVILDSELCLPLDSKITLTANEQNTLLITSKHAVDKIKENQLEALGLEIHKINADGCRLNLNEVLSELYRRNIQLIMVEAGSQINTSFLKSGLVDKLVMFIAPKLLGGNNLAWQDLGIENIAHAPMLTDMSYLPCGIDILLTAYPHTNS